MKNGYSIFFISFVAAILFTGLERLVGLGTGFHPDSLYYLEYYQLYTSNIYEFSQYLNNFYFFVVRAAGGNEIYLLFFNWTLFGLTNVVIFIFIGKKINPIALIVMFLPYRLHLSAHILKDTAIIFLPSARREIFHSVVER